MSIGIMSRHFLEESGWCVSEVSLVAFLFLDGGIERRQESKQAPLTGFRAGLVMQDLSSGVARCI